VVPEVVQRQVRELLAVEPARDVAAVREVVDRTGMPLSDARDVVEALRLGIDVPTQVADLPDLPDRPATVDPQVWALVHAEVEAGSPIAAMSILYHRAGVGLPEAMLLLEEAGLYTRPARKRRWWKWWRRRDAQ
jgi:hypothetical protein